MADPVFEQTLTITGNVSSSSSVSVSVNILPITEDGARVVLHERLKFIALGPLALAWFGIFITIALTLVTAKFEDRFGFPAATIQAAFVLAMLSTLLLAGWYGIRFIAHRPKSSVDGLVAEMRRKAGVK
ncbi:MAG TPA: hypothetical protein VHM92_05290 [Allosphingosinicella sp.]|nr:hypothetical protein [Allosphingosinicella sp.]